jgi:pyridoxal phosphate enzyme (YggS family)
MELAITTVLKTLLAQIAQAAVRAGKKSQDIVIVGVTKTHPPETVQAALRAGLVHIGENKVQEAAAKREIIGHRGTWHMIGHLQKNKVKQAARIFDWVDSVDSLELARALNDAAHEAGKKINVLLQVNTSGESSKFGIKPDAAASLAEQINALPRLTLRGLMTMAPFYEDAERTRPCFAALRECRDAVEKSTGLSLPELSMGMSNDFLVAVEEGATQVRLGTALFGPRPRKKLQAQSDDPA